MFSSSVYIQREICYILKIDGRVEGNIDSNSQIDRSRQKHACQKKSTFIEIDVSLSLYYIYVCVCVLIDFLDRKKRKKNKEERKIKETKNFRAKIVIKERNKWRGRKFRIGARYRGIYNGIVSVNFLQCNVASGKIICRIAKLSRNSLRVTTL